MGAEERTASMVAAKRYFSMVSSSSKTKAFLAEAVPEDVIGEVNPPGSPATVFCRAERRPVALRPMLSHGLPLSGYLSSHPIGETGWGLKNM
jgi:hypothetical protein